MGTGTVSDWLTAQGAARDVVVWAEAYGSDFRDAFQHCPRGDWLLAVAARAGASRPLLTRAALACLRLGLQEVRPPAELTSAVEIAAALAEGEVAEDTRQAVKRDLENVVPEDAAIAALATAASVCLATDEEPESLALVPALVVEAALLGVIDCAWTSLMRHTQQATADAVRAHVPWESLRCHALGRG